MDLLLTNLYVADGNGAAIVVDAPAILLDAVDTLGIGTDIVNVKRQDGVVGVDIYVVSVISRTLEPITVNTLDEAFAF